MTSDFGEIENEVTAKFRIVTPMFLGGANHEADEIRPASVKGMLRFWWRAMNWSKFRGAANATDASALKALHDEEARLFGSSAKTVKGKQTGGQGVFLLSVKQQTKLHSWTKVEPQVGYLLGMGLYHFKNGVTRSSMAGEFSVALRFRDSAEQDDRASVLEALRAFGLLGGLGSRQRRGLGSVAITSVSGVEKIVIASNRAAYGEQVNRLLADKVTDLPLLTAFSSKSKISFLEKSNANEALKAMGDELGVYRGWGRDGKVFGKQAERNFREDHDNMDKAAKGEAYDALPKRLIFGVPHNYRFSSGGSVSIQNTALKLQRRASPLFIHVHQFSQGESALGVMLILPAQFLPANDKVEVKGRISKMHAANLDWAVMEKLLQRPAFTQGTKV